MYKYFSHEQTKYKNIIFDLGNVLIEFKPKKYVNQILDKETNKSYEETLQRVLQFITETQHKDFDCGSITEEQIIQKSTSKLSNHQIRYFLDNVDQYLIPIKSGISILEKIKAKNYKIYVISNFPKELFDRIYLHNDFLKSFDGMVISSHIKLIKPNIKIYKHFLEKYKLNPKECLFIDDRQENIDSAQSCGIDGILCSDHNVVLEELKKRKVL